jgi:hypothetical protein
MNVLAGWERKIRFHGNCISKRKLTMIVVKIDNLMRIKTWWLNPVLWLTPIIQATWESEIRRITVQGKPRQKVQETPISTNESWVLEGRADCSRAPFFRHIPSPGLSVLVFRPRTQRAELWGSLRNPCGPPRPAPPNRKPETPRKRSASQTLTPSTS